ncbi:MAG: DUF1284 domain-containing protein [Syntrophales bacterium]|nr:DUF1284 domain-containing protein [Syntrophales bacterium]
MEQVLRLRGHHLFCLQFFKGEGYSKGFVENLRKIVGRWGGEKAVLVNGADDVCKECPHLADGGCAYFGEDKIREEDRLALSLLDLHVGDTVTKRDILVKMTPRIRDTWRKNNCEGCIWEAICFPEEEE